MIVMGAGTNHWFHSDQIYRAMLAPRPVLRLPGRQRRRLGALRRPGEGAPDHRLVDGRLRARLVAAAAPAAGDAVLVPGLRPVALRDASAPSSSRRPPATARSATATWPTATRSPRGSAGCPPTRRFNRNPLDLCDEAQRARASSPPSTSSPSCRRAGCASPARTPTTRPTSRACSRSGAPTCSAPRARATSTSCATSSASPTPPSAASESAPEQRPREVEWRDEAPVGKLDLFTTIDFRMNGSCIYSDVVLPAATWYEKHDLSSTDLHPFVHPFNAAIPPPWETKTDWDAFNRIAGRVQPPGRKAPRHPHATSSPRRSCTTPRTSSPSRWAGSATGRPASASRSRARRCRSWSPVERDYTAVAEKMNALGPLVEKAGIGAKGVSWKPEPEVAELGRRNGRANGGGSGDGRPLAAPRRRRLRGDPGALGDHQRPARGRGLPRARAPDRPRARRTSPRSAPTSGSRFGEIGIQPRKVIASAEWSGLESRERRYSPFTANVELLIPWRTLTGRQQLFVDHDWMLDLGEGLPAYRPPVDAGQLLGLAARREPGRAARRPSRSRSAT